MIPALPVSTLPQTAETLTPPAAALPLPGSAPLLPAFMLGGSVMPPASAPLISETPVVEEIADPQQLLQLLLDPALAAPIVTPQLQPQQQPQQQLQLQPLPNVMPLAVPALPPGLAGAAAAEALAPAMQSVTPTTQPLTNPQRMLNTGSVTMLPPQPFKLRTPQDARTASQQIVALMQAHPEETLAKALPQQHPLQTLPLFQGPQPATPGGIKQPALVLPAQPEARAATLRDALGERLQLQIEQRSQKATIRLDPPNLGKLDISLHYEGGKLQVQIQAAQPDVYRALQQVSQELRGALSEHNQVAVNVQISQQQQGEQRHAPRQPPSQETVLANNSFEEVTGEQRHHDLSILTTV